MTTADRVRELQAKLNAPLLDCKRALEWAHDNMELAEDWLRLHPSRRPKSSLQPREDDNEPRQFVTGTAMPTLRHILAMIDRGEPIAHIRDEVQSLLMRAGRSI